MPPIKKKGKKEPTKKRDRTLDLVPNEWMGLSKSPGSGSVVYLKAGNGLVELCQAIKICPIWDIEIGDYAFRGCILKEDFFWKQDARCGTHQYVATVPDGPTLLLSGKEKLYPRRDLHEERKKEVRLSRLKARLDKVKRKAGRAEEEAAKVRAQISELEGA